MRRRVFSIALVGSSAVGLALAWGAPALDVLLYFLYEGLFVVLPGWLAYRALASDAGDPVRQLALGWALGYVLELLAFMATAATGARFMFFLYPLLVAGLALATLRRRGFGPRIERLPPTVLPALAFTAMVTLGCVAVGLFPITPLPGEEAVNLNQDHLWALTIAGEAKHHWPITDPSISGEPFPYHWSVHVHWAAASNVTGVDLPTVAYRLAPLAAVMSAVLLFAAAGRALLGSWAAGLIAACFCFVVGELQLDTSLTTLQDSIPFIGVLFTLLIQSPSFLFGLAFFLALVLFAGELLDRERPAGPGDWLLFGLFAIGAAQAKVSILPPLIAALIAYVGVAWLRSRRISRAGVYATGLLAGVVILQYLLLYRGHSSGLTPALDAGVNYIGDMPVVLSISDWLKDCCGGLPGAEPLISVAKIPFGLLGLLGAQLLGIVYLLARRPLSLSAREWWLLAVLGAGLAQLFFIEDSPGGNQLYGFYYCVLAGCLLSAHGLLKLFRAAFGEGLGWRRVAVVGVPAALCLALLIIVPVHLGLDFGDEYLVWYLGLSALVLLTWLAARAILDSRTWAAALAGAVILSVGLVERPVDTLQPGLLRSHAPPETGRRTTPDLHAALTWIRENTSVDAVLAVNSNEADFGPYEYMHSAYAERRVFLGGWGYSIAARDSNIREATGAARITFPGRLALNDAAFRTGSASAIETMRRDYGVRYLVIDEINGFDANLPRLRRLGSVVFRAPGVTVLAVT